MTAEGHPVAGCLLEQSPSGWRLYCGNETVELDAFVSFSTLAEAVKASIASEKTPARCVLGLASSECFFSIIESDDKAIGKERSATKYELERCFPLDAESMVFDAWPIPSEPSDTSSRRIAAIAVDESRLKGLVDALEDVAVDLMAIVPTVSLIAHTAVASLTKGSNQTLLIATPDSCDYVEAGEKGLSQWKHWHQSLPELSVPLRLAESDSIGDEPLRVIGVGEDDREKLAEVSDRSVEPMASSAADLAKQTANRILSGRLSLTPNLRRDGFAARDPLVAVARPLRLATIAAFMSTLILLTASWLRTSKLEETVQSVSERQRMAFREAFPERRVPVLMMRTIRKEHRQTMGSRGRGRSVTLPTPATTVLADLLAGLSFAQQAKARFRILDVSVADGEASVTVRTRQAEEIGVIAKSLERSGFRADPPATQQVPSSRDEPIVTYQSTLTLRWLGTENNGNADSPNEEVDS
ncbi:MAG: hypothetical protein AAGJ83_06205 [Planctomycetota bacterium]